MASWPIHLLQRPLPRMLLLSACLHLAVIMLVQPRPFPARDATVVISARLIEPAGAPPLPARAPPPEPHDMTPPATPLPAEPALPATVSLPGPVTEPSPLTEPPAVAAHQAEAVAAPQAAAAARAPTPPARASEPPVPSLPSIPVMLDTNWYEAKQLDISPRAAQPINPVYPLEAARRGIEGTVKLLLRVDEYGVVKDVQVMEGEPPGIFDQSAVEAFRTGKFLPARKDGRPVRAQISIRVRYELDD